jgi:cysteine desulfurase family protein (TIGR01976 family)
MTETTQGAADRVSSTARIRTRFPALERRHQGERVAYFDGPGGTLVPREVVAAMTDYLYHHNANTHWVYPTSIETDEAIASARAVLADFLNAEPDEIAFGLNMTTLTFHLARAIGRSLGRGDEIIVTELDHHANVAPWQAVAQERGATLRTVRMDPATGQLDTRDLEDAFNPRSRVLAIGAASNALGTVNDVAHAVALARTMGTLTFVDAVHSAPHVLVDVRELNCDFLACSAYKFHGPHVGVLYGKRERIAALDVPKVAAAPDLGPERLETGTQNHEGMVGAAAAVEFLASLAPGESRRAKLQRVFAALHQRGATLFARLWHGLNAIPGVRLYGPPPDAPRTPTVSFTLDGLPSSEVARLLAARGVFVSSGDFYATTVVERLGAGAEGFVRAGCSCYTTDAEVDRLVGGVRDLVR